MKARLKHPLRTLRRWHRWAGVGAAVFVIWLAATGLLLNHSSSLGLDSRYLTVPGLLAGYGVETPEFGPSYQADDRRVSLLDSTIYVDAAVVSEGMDSLAGAVVLGGDLVIVGGNEILFVDAYGDVIERWPTRPEAAGDVAAIAMTADGLLLRTGEGDYLFDWMTTLIEPVATASMEPRWVEPTPLPAELADAIVTDFQGSGVSIERLLLDLHSGRIIGISGPLIMDLAALAMLLLAVSGVIIWWRR